MLINLNDKVQLADQLYVNVFGDTDDKRFQAAKTQEILDWLNDGDPQYFTFDELVGLWVDHDEEAHYDQ